MKINQKQLQGLGLIYGSIYYTISSFIILSLSNTYKEFTFLLIVNSIFVFLFLILVVRNGE